MIKTLKYIHCAYVLIDQWLLSRPVVDNMGRRKRGRKERILTDLAAHFTGLSGLGLH